MTDHAQDFTMGHRPFPFSNLDAVVATFQMVNNTSKWKVTLQRLGRLRLYSWLCPELAGVSIDMPLQFFQSLYATSIFLVSFFHICKCLAVKTQLFKIVFVFCGVLAGTHEKGLFQAGTSRGSHSPNNNGKEKGMTRDFL